MNAIQQLWNEIIRAWDGMNRRQRLLISALGLGSLLALLLFVIWAGRPNYTTAYTGLSEEDAAEIVDILQKQGVAYQLTGDGTTIQVPAQDLNKVRLDVARQGLPRGGTVGFELFDQGGLGNLGMTEFSQRVNYQRALEGELARTIGALDGVEQARVHLVIPEEALFTENQAKPTASVMLKLQPGRSLREDQIWGIGNLVASSVEGLEADNATIVDVHGRVLAEGAASQAADKSGLRLSMAQISAERDVERDLESRLQQMLNTALGLNKAVVKVNADLNWAQVETTSEEFNPETGSQAGVIRSLRQTLETTDGITVSGGVPGVDANVVPVYQPAITGTRGAGLIRHDATVNYEVSKTVMHTVNAPGDIKRLSVAVLLDSNDANLVAQQPAIEQMVQAAIGYSSSRGDTVTVDLLSFDNQLGEDVQAMEDAQRRAQYMELARVGAAVLGVLFLLFFVRRTFRRLEERVFVDLGPAPVPQLEGPAARPESSVDVLEGTPDMLEGSPAPATTLLDQMEAQIEEEEPEGMDLDLAEVRRRKRFIQLAEENPDTIARVVQRWLNEE
ncbi:MAG: Flagellar M-ring protein [Anaerolineales bacterium]|nr:Flagellar M-ring protein [Anaerolineales bacterium]